MEKCKDGWHSICGYDVYVEDGFILRGVKDNGQLPSYVYRACRYGGWGKEERISIEAFRAGVRRGTIIMT